MDYKELMCGDWVVLKSNGVQPDTKIRITELSTDGGFVDDCDNFIGYEELDPIPLTEDILVKNGFEKQGDLYQYHINAGNGYTRIDIIDLQDGLWSYDIDVYDKFVDAHKIHHDDDCFLKLHQLQHLFILVGVQKDIKL